MIRHIIISVLITRKYADIRAKSMSLEQFPDGKWYTMSEEKRLRDKLKPLVIHNNWIIGNTAKMDRAKKFNQWFWDSDSAKCDLGLVNSTTH